MQTKLACHTASLYFWYSDQEYVSHLDDRIHACLDAGCDGVEISNGVFGILDWQPAKETLSRLRRPEVVLTIHAELAAGVTVMDLTRKLAALALPVCNIVFHPTELLLLCDLSQLSWPVSIENMDSMASAWQTCWEVSQMMTSSHSTGFTYDTAHIMENRINPMSFASLFPPTEVHLSISKWDGSSGTKYVMTNNQSWFPYIPSGTSLIVLEGVMPDREALEQEVEYVREMLSKRGFF